MRNQNTVTEFSNIMQSNESALDGISNNIGRIVFRMKAVEAVKTATVALFALGIIVLCAYIGITTHFANFS